MISVLDQNPRGRWLISFCVTGSLLSILFVGIRFWSRAVVLNPRRGMRFWWDDWLCLAALPPTLVQFILVIYRCVIGLGLHIDRVPRENITPGLILFVAHWNVWCLSVMLPKLSALAFYARLFGNDVRRVLRLALWFMVLINVVLTIVSMLLGTLRCSPVEKMWEPLLPGQCMNIATLWTALNAVEIVIDLLILWIPLPMLWKLKLQWRHKALIVAVFILGYACIANTIARFVYVLQLGGDLLDDFTFSTVPIVYIAASWPTTALICICLPHLFTLARRAYHQGFRSLFIPSSGSATSHSRSGGVTPVPSGGHWVVYAGNKAANLSSRYTGTETSTVTSAFGGAYVPRAGGFFDDVDDVERRHTYPDRPLERCVHYEPARWSAPQALEDTFRKFQGRGRSIYAPSRV